MTAAGWRTQTAITTSPGNGAPTTSSTSTTTTTCPDSGCTHYTMDFTKGCTES